MPASAKADDGRKFGMWATADRAMASQQNPPDALLRQASTEVTPRDDRRTSLDESTIFVRTPPKHHYVVSGGEKVNEKGVAPLVCYCLLLSVTVCYWPS